MNNETDSSQNGCKPGNIAFVDGQNLICGTRYSKNPWKIDLKRLRVYLDEKYNVITANYFVGSYIDEHIEMYSMLEKYGYNVIYRKHNANFKSRKKGNVDTDIVFYVMKHLIEKPNKQKIVLVSGDGDYYRTVEYLIKNNSLVKVLAPDQHCMSSLYKNLNPRYFAFLNGPGMKRKLGKKNAGTA